MVDSLIIWKLLAFLGRKFILKSGLILIRWSNLALRFITYVDSYIILIIVCLTIWGLQGFLSSIIQTMLYAIDSIMYKENEQKFRWTVKTLKKDE